MSLVSRAFINLLVTEDSGHYVLYSFFFYNQYPNISEFKEREGGEREGGGREREGGGRERGGGETEIGERGRERERERGEQRERERGGGEREGGRERGVG